jgi:predicted metalloprotease
MEWENFRRSDNIEDRRDDGGSIDTGGGGGGGIGGAGGLGIGAVIVLGLIGWALGIDPRVLINGAEMVNNARNSGQYTQQYTQNTQPRSQPQRKTGTPSDQMGQFVAAILAQTEDVWSSVLPDQKGIQYTKPKLVLYTGRTQSGCGGAQAAMGPFYCPEDKKVYLDLSFFNDMKRKLGGGGDFAYAYVIAHEIGHHIQDELGILGKVQAAEQRASKTQANAMSVRIELMADCLAGVWAANANEKYHVIQDGDVEKAVNTAKAIGDDRLQQAAQGEVVPDSFTHGSSAQRVQWLNTGLQSGKIDSCNTFAR